MLLQSYLALDASWVGVQLWEPCGQFTLVLQWLVLLPPLLCLVLAIAAHGGAHAALGVVLVASRLLQGIGHFQRIVFDIPVWGGSTIRMHQHSRCKCV